MKDCNRFVGMASMLVIGVMSLQATVFADSASNSNNRSERIVGVWDVGVVIRNCATKAPMMSFNALHQYQQGGTGQVVPNSGPTSLSAHMMIWNHIQQDDYEMAFKMFRFDAQGNNMGWVVVRSEVNINQDANEYVGSGIADFYNAAGVRLFSSCPELVGTRFEG